MGAVETNIDVFASVTQKQVNKNKKKQKGTENGGDNKKESKKSRNTKKIVHDLFVQGTNDSSIVSKRSVEILYREKVEGTTSKPYFQHFVKKSPRRTPVINRGYWIRMKSIRMAIEKIIEQQPSNQRINIINLGCGYDPLPFQLLDDAKFENTEIYCIDVDFPQLIGYKSEMIKMAPELMELIGEFEKTDIPGISIKTKNYATMGCDLTDKELYIKQLNSFMASDSNTTNIFIAEVSLAYMTPDTANPIINTSSTFSNSHFLLLEQLMQSGENHPFAKRMMKHFKKMEAPLQCVSSYPKISDQIQRFAKLGYKSVNARDLLTCWELVPNEIKAKVESVEAFDEWEEFAFFGQHYINLHATNQENVQVYNESYGNFYEPLEPLKSSQYKFNVQELDEKYQRKFHTCLSNNSVSFLTCGTNQSRLSDTIQISRDGDSDVKLMENDEFRPRIGSTSVTIGDDMYLLGGRRIPGVGLTEFWKLNRLYNNSNNYEWVKLADIPSGKVKHTSIEHESRIVVYGGTSLSDSFIYYEPAKDEWFNLNSSFGEICSSSKLVKLGNGKIYLIGGMINGDDFKFNAKVLEVEIDFDEHLVKVHPVFEHKSLARYGFSVIVDNESLLVVGGIGNKLYNQDDTIVRLDFSGKEIKLNSIRIDDETWNQSSVLIGSDLISYKNQHWLVGGGAVCYGFGSVWGNIFSIGINQNTENIYLK